MTDRILNNARFLSVDDVGKISDADLCRSPAQWIPDWLRSSAYGRDSPAVRQGATRAMRVMDGSHDQAERA